MTVTESGQAGSPSFPDHPDADLYDHLLRRAHVTGRCPVWVSPADLEHTLERPDDPDELFDAIDRLDGEAVLARWWPGPCGAECPCRDPFPVSIPRARALRPTRDLARRPETFDAAIECARGASGPLALVDAYRPADTPAVLGWSGAGHHPHHDLVGLAAVLRYWERRWGALVVALTRSRMYLSVARPPMYDDECEQVAGEHLAFCAARPDPQNGDGHSLRRYVGTIRGAGVWSFGWAR